MFPILNPPIRSQGQRTDFHFLTLVFCLFHMVPACLFFGEESKNALQLFEAALCQALGTGLFISSLR